MAGRSLHQLHGLYQHLPYRSAQRSKTRNAGFIYFGQVYCLRTVSAGLPLQGHRDHVMTTKGPAG